MEGRVRHQLAGGYRPLQPSTPQELQQHGQPQHLIPHQTLASQAGLDLEPLDDGEETIDFLQRFQESTTTQSFHSPAAFDRNPGQDLTQPRTIPTPHTPQQETSGQFGVLTPNNLQHDSISRLQQEESVFESPESSDQKSNGHMPSDKFVMEPPNLAEWRKKLFDVDEMITLSEEEFQTYFAHVDNVYSHRSTQKYKRKPFVSHYWDCRLKGRPPGTPKSDDPNKKKRKRTARERDLCDVKIKITEYFPSPIHQPAFMQDDAQDGMDQSSDSIFAPDIQGGPLIQSLRRRLAEIHHAKFSFPEGHPGANGQRYYTIQRVNGNGGNGKGDGVAGPHKHTLEESDAIKKSSVARNKLKQAKEKKKAEKTYHKRASGAALVTVKKHSREHELKLFGSCFCPFVQRVWIALEAKGLQYQYIEVDPYKKPQSLLEINPRGLVPALQHGKWGCGESTVLMEYLEDLDLGASILPPLTNPQLRANCRFWADHINRNIVPAFYQLLQAQEFDKQAENTKKLQDEISKLVDAADPQGPFFLGSQISYVDIQFAPWMLRCSRVLKPYRGWQDPAPGSKWARWVDAIENDEYVKATISSKDLYIDSYERYAENRPNTSELANAINAGHGLP